MVTCLLTQPQPRVAALCEQVRAAGAEALELAFNRLEPIAGAEASLRALDFERFDRIVFVSPSAVWFARAAIDMMARADRPRIAVIGAGTDDALHAQRPGLPTLRPASGPYDAEHLAAMPEMQAKSNRAMLVIRADRGRDDWIARCREQGVEVTVIALYRSVATNPDLAAIETLGRLAVSQARVITLVSSMGLAERLIGWQPGVLADRSGQNAVSLSAWLRDQPVLVSHPRIAGRLTDGGFGSMVLPSDGQSLVGAAIQWAHENA